ncbi:hypothetical protein D8674_024169 [Pyrus ussuriensis x Pyrus communis]|uniref:Reverse transcriptase domain-containing protein n=1 Tax=Pyrus ussuriensis x Pyrus communis TaxID=2448454 RepID=A0A5N5H460_9ROSA|nr:hypothetical protein D8674_024169 [Pyrus ussuriensis x Pyrus communis]
MGIRIQGFSSSQVGRVGHYCYFVMAKSGVDELVVQLNQTLELSTMEQGVKLVGKVLTPKPLNKWGVRNILRAAWKELGEVEIKWVRENVFIISVKDENVASKILEQVPWAVMKKVFSVVKWPPELALEELELDAVPFWVQIRGIPLAGKFIAMEDPGHARGFVRVRILVDTEKPLFKGCWIRRDSNKEIWVEFRYERLQDFCYKCGRIGHINTECSVEVSGDGEVAYGEWIKTPPVREVVISTRVECVGRGGRRQAGAVRGPGIMCAQNQGSLRISNVQGMKCNQTMEKKKWRRRMRVEAEDTSSCSEMESIKTVGEGRSGEFQGGNNILSAQGDDPLWGSKRSGEAQDMVLTQAPQKKLKGPDTEENYQGRVAETGRRLNCKEGELSVERAVRTTGEDKEEISENLGGQEVMEGGSDIAKGMMVTRKAGKLARGGSDTTVRALHGLIRKKRPSMIFLSKTKMKDHRILGVRRRLGYLHGFDVSPIGFSGGLSLWWEDNLEVNVIFSSKHIIDAVMRIKGQMQWSRITGVYGTSYRVEKSLFWEWMVNHFTPTDIPWICGGDFNEFLWDHEKSGGVEVLYNRPRFLEEFLSSSQLMDLGFNGPTFTWRGLRKGDWVEERLDRVMANEKWQQLWPNSHVMHETVLASDHCPIVLSSSSEGQKGRKMFRNLVEKCWDRRHHGSPVNRWVRSLNDCRYHLSRWNRTKFKRRGGRIHDLLSQLDSLQRDWGPNYVEIREISRQIDELRLQEESYWCQRSRVKWLREGDANTQFCHSSTLQRRRRNKIVKLRAKNGNWVENCINPSVSAKMNEALTAPVTEDEIKEAAGNMGGLKAPGPDGFQGIFYQTYWEIVKEDVSALVRELLQDVAGSSLINQTHIVLIPKVPNPEFVSQFRPISLCNYSYKILSKILANRLKVLLPKIISPSQNAFVAGRQIQDCIGIAHEMFHYLKGRKARNRFEMGIKLDMQKAYDRVEWDFLDAVMERMGFSSSWRSLINGCISSVKFAVLLNGQAGESFAPSRGLRQGDPLSPYLFILVGEVLSKLIQGAVDQGRLEGVKIGGSGPVISHLFFADDTLLFLRADVKNCRNLRHMLDKFCVASGQKVNLEKSSVFFGANVPKVNADQMGNALGMAVVINPGTYLGVPAIWGRSKKRGLAYVKGRVMEKLQGWKQSTLSRAGKEVLIKAVIQAIPAYPMCIFKFPAAVCQELDALVAGFWWGCKEGAQKIHWVSKEVLGLPKDMGGLGFRNFQEFNDALLAKHFLQPFISGETMQAIEETPLGDLSRNDRLIWDLSKNGSYLVKSGYRWLQGRSLARRDKRRPSVRGVPKAFWKGIWKLEVPPKLRHFLWLTVHNCLPTREALFRRWSSLASTWALGYKMDRLSLPSWLDWIQEVFSPNFCNSRDTLWRKSYIVFTCWCIWKARCDFVFKGVSVNPLKVLVDVSAAMSSFFGAMAMAGVRGGGDGRRDTQVARWCAPASPFVKINVDASWSKASKMGFVGLIARDMERKFVAAARYAITAPSAAAAEAYALLHGCQLGEELGVRYVILESDSLEAIKCLSSSLSRGSWEAFPVLARVKQLGGKFLDCRWSWVPRSANGVAHKIASVGFTEMCDVVWVVRPPSSLVFVLNNDGLPCPH